MVAAEFIAFEIEAAAVYEEGLIEVAFEGAEDLAAETGAALADSALEADRGLDRIQKASDLVDERALAAEVEGALATIFAPDEAVVGAEASAAVGSPGGGDGALVGETFVVVAEELDGGALFGHGRGLLGLGWEATRTNSIQIYTSVSIVFLGTRGICSASAAAFAVKRRNAVSFLPEKEGHAVV